MIPWYKNDFTKCIDFHHNIFDIKMGYFYKILKSFINFQSS